MILFLGLAIFQNACISSKKPAAKTSQTVLDRNQLFPDGVYVHQVKIFPKNGKVRKMKVVVSIAPKVIKLVSLSPFNTTLFRLQEDRASGDISMKIFGPFPDKIKSEFESFYKTLRQLLLFSLKLYDDKKPIDLVVEYNDHRFPILLKSKESENRIHLGQYDDNRIPRKLDATHPMFDATVKISRYELTEEK